MSTTPRKANMDLGTVKMPSPVKRSENDTEAVNEIIKKMEEEVKYYGFICLFMRP